MRTRRLSARLQRRQTRLPRYRGRESPLTECRRRSRSQDFARSARSHPRPDSFLATTIHGSVGFSGRWAEPVARLHLPCEPTSPASWSVRLRLTADRKDVPVGILKPGDLLVIKRRDALLVGVQGVAVLLERDAAAAEFVDLSFNVGDNERRHGRSRGARVTWRGVDVQPCALRKRVRGPSVTVFLAAREAELALVESLRLIDVRNRDDRVDPAV